MSEQTPGTNVPENPDGSALPTCDRGMLYATVTITGAAIMMLEILGTRLIGPFYGVSLFVWSSLISVALIALSVGYYLGGIVADRFDWFRMSYCIALAGVFSALIPLMREPVLLVTNPLGVRAGAFFSAFILFTVPLTLLAMIGPCVIKLSARQLESVGVASGTVYAVSTVGSVVGTLVLSFFLLPNFGTRIVLFSVSAVLLLLAIALVWFEKRQLRLNSSLLVVVVLAAVAGGLSWIEYSSKKSSDVDFQVIHESESHYGRIRVLNDRRFRVRWLLSDSSTISGAQIKKIASNDTAFPYLRVLEKLTALKPEGRRALVVGMGGGYLPRALESRGMICDSIEIDQAVVDAARKYFAFEPKGKVIVGDARYAIRELEGGYDFVIHDCFSGGVNPTHLLSVEMFREMRSLLSEDGVFALNYFGFSQGPRSQSVAAVDETLAAVFPHRLRLLTSVDEELADNLFVASMRPLSLAPTADDDESTAADKLKLRELAEKAAQVPQEQGFLITDDYNPLESMQVAKAEAYRAKLLKLISRKQLAE